VDRKYVVERTSIEQSFGALTLDSGRMPRLYPDQNKAAPAQPTPVASDGRTSTVSSLLNLPSELQLHILEHLPPSGVHNAQRVNHQLNALAAPSLYKKLYGASVLHRAPTSAALDAKHLALEKERLQQQRPAGWLKADDLHAKANLSDWLEETYDAVADAPLKDLRVAASISLVRLQNAVGADKELWHEAVAAWLMVQGRKDEAVDHYEKAFSLARTRAEPALNELVRIVDARFDIPQSEGFVLPPWTELGQLTRHAAFAAACRGGRISVARALMQHNLSNNALKTGLEYAVKSNQRVLVQALEPEAAALSIRTNLMLLAVERGHLGIVQDFHAAGVSLESRFHNESTATVAAKSNRVHILEYLQEQGVSLMAPCFGQVGLTPIHWAVEMEAADAVAYLVSLGASVNTLEPYPTLFNRSGEKPHLATSLQRAMVHANVDVVEAMMKNGPTFNSLVASPTGGWLRALLDRAYDEHGKDEQRVLRVVDLVFEQKHADINAMDVFEKTAWQYAKASRGTRVVARLLELGADTES
jgi:ankyrin repeat protein